MKLYAAVCIFFLTTFVYADNNASMSPENNITFETQTKEITRLQEKVKELETELASYKKVKPVAIKALIPKKMILTRKENTHRKEFTFSAEIPKKLSAYYTADLQTLDVLKENLESNGFTVLATDEILKGKTVVSFTNEALRNSNSFLSVLHLLINRDKEIRVQNPSYFAAAFLQDQYKYGDFNATLKDLESVLGKMYEVEEQYNSADLSEYHFMFGMPSVNDTILVAKDENLTTKLKQTDKSVYISYVLDLPNGSTLVGHKLPDETYQYLEKINAEHNAQIFPYEVMIKNGRAVMLSPKYYLALSLPLLSMTDFLKIVSAPEAIINDIKKAYK